MVDLVNFRPHPTHLHCEENWKSFLAIALKGELASDSFSPGCCSRHTWPICNTSTFKSLSVNLQRTIKFPLRNQKNPKGPERTRGKVPPVFLLVANLSIHKWAWKLTESSKLEPSEPSALSPLYIISTTHVPSIMDLLTLFNCKINLNKSYNIKCMLRSGGSL